MTDGLNRKTTYEYDTRGNMITLTRLAGTPDAVSWTYTYDPVFSQRTSATDPLQHTSRFTYDAEGHLTSATDRSGRTET